MHLPEFMQCYMAINKLFARVMNKAEGARIVGASSSPTLARRNKIMRAFP